MRIGAEAQQLTHLREGGITAQGSGQSMLLQRLVDLPEDGGLRLGDVSVPGVETFT